LLGTASTHFQELTPFSTSSKSCGLSEYTDFSPRLYKVFCEENFPNRGAWNYLSPRAGRRWRNGAWFRWRCAAHGRRPFLARQAALVFHSEQVAAKTLNPVYDGKPTNQDLELKGLKFAAGLRRV
jgi:hypothetical protein